MKRSRQCTETNKDTGIGLSNEGLSARRVVLRFPRHLLARPVICELTRKHDLLFNILRANITSAEEGFVVLELSGTARSLEKGVEFLKEIGVGVEPLSQDIRWAESRCTHCGACLVQCPVRAFIRLSDGSIFFDASKCVGCELCVRGCPPRAIEVTFPAIGL